MTSIGVYDSSSLAKAGPCHYQPAPRPTPQALLVHWVPGGAGTPCKREWRAAGMVMLCEADKPRLRSGVQGTGQPLHPQAAAE